MQTRLRQGQRLKLTTLQGQKKEMGKKRNIINGDEYFSNGTSIIATDCEHWTICNKCCDGLRILPYWTSNTANSQQWTGKYKYTETVELIVRDVVLLS